MIKKVKKRIEEMFELNTQIINNFLDQLSQGKYLEAQETLCDCQEAMIMIGNTIDESEGEKCKTVAEIERYCELLFVIHEELNCPEIADIESINERLKSANEIIGQSIENDIKVKKQIVFLPYKAAMWDSMDSIWRAAKEDNTFDVKVVPIPYFDRNPDGSYAKGHYEGNELPKDVEITLYKEFNLEEEHPDVIVIHNPYDDTNFITTVAEPFYSSNLKKCTDKLIYIPYFVVGEANLKDKAETESMFHFAQVPAVVNADVTIVQSENTKQLYVEALTAIFGEKSRKKWECKIKGISSAKYDIRRVEETEANLSAEWLKMLKKPDGTRKKVVMYNTSITAFLNNPDLVIEKIGRVHQMFKEKKDEVLLWWRPHPLMLATIDSMRPNTKEAYMDIVNKYKTEAWGIYDDTADLNRAISVADAYYGDESSLAFIFISNGMPVMIQNINM